MAGANGGAPSASPSGPVAMTYEQLKYQHQRHLVSLAEGGVVPVHHVASLVADGMLPMMAMDRAMPVLRPVEGGSRIVVPSSSPASAGPGKEAVMILPSSYSSRSSNVELLGEHSPNDVLFIKCLPCGKTYGNIHKFKKHFIKEHQNEPTRSDISVQTISATKDALAARDGQHHAVPLGDGLAGALVHSRSPLRVQRPGERNADFTPSSAVDEQDSVPPPRTTPGGSLQCTQCGEEFGSREFSLYRRHCQQHDLHWQRKEAADDGSASRNPFACDLCRASFVDARVLIQHLRSVHGDPGTVTEATVTMVDKSVSAPVFCPPLILKATPDSTSISDDASHTTAAAADLAQSVPRADNASVKEPNEPSETKPTAIAGSKGYKYSM
jgi:hypothetical protein